MYSLTFFNILIWISLIGLLVDFGFQIWFNVADSKNKQQSKGE